MRWPMHLRPAQVVLLLRYSLKRNPWVLSPDFSWDLIIIDVWKMLVLLKKSTFGLLKSALTPLLTIIIMTKVQYFGLSWKGREITHLIVKSDLWPLAYKKVNPKGDPVVCFSSDVLFASLTFRDKLSSFLALKVVSFMFLHYIFFLQQLLFFDQK